MVSGPATISGATVTLTGAGTVVLMASEAADSNFAAGIKNATFTVGLGTPTITFTVPNQTYGAAPFAVRCDLELDRGLHLHRGLGPGDHLGRDRHPDRRRHRRAQASEAADSNYAAATKTATFTVGLGTPTIAFTVANQTYGAAPFAVSATSNSTGAFTYTVVSGPATISGATVTLTGAGTVVLMASEAADSNYAAGIKNATFTVGLGTPTITFTVPNQTYGAAPFAVTATSNSTGAFTYSVVSGPATISGATVTLTGAGTVVLQASEAADSNYAAATKNATFTVGLGTPTIAFTVANQTYGAAPFAVRCHLELDRGVHLHGGLGPGDHLGRDRHPDRGRHRGAHGVRSRGQQLRCRQQERHLHRGPGHSDHRLHRPQPDLRRGSLRRRCHLELDRGLHLLGGLGPGDALGRDRHPDRGRHRGAQASEAADSNYAAATKNATFTVGLGTPTIAFTVPNQTYGAAPFAVSATSNSTGAFTYSVVSGPATISGATVTLTGAGTVVLMASEAADSNYAAGSKNATFTVGLGTPAITFTVPNQTYGAAPFAVTATSNSTGAFTYTVVSGPATISGATVTLTGAGTVVLRRLKRPTATTPPAPRTPPSPWAWALRPSPSPCPTRPTARHRSR